MAYRPYFKHGIEELEALAATSRSDLNALKIIQFELNFRNRPKARALKAEVNDLVCRLSADATVEPSRPVPRPRGKPIGSAPEHPPHPTQTVPDRVVIECANCKTTNFVSTLDGVLQHLSCSACMSPYEAQFKYGVMRTTFQAKPTPKSSGSALKWIIIGIAFLIVLALLKK